MKLPNRESKMKLPNRESKMKLPTMMDVSPEMADVTQDSAPLGNARRDCAWDNELGGIF